MKLMNSTYWLVIAAILTLLKGWDGEIELGDKIVILGCILFFYLSVICEVLMDKNKG